MFNYKIWNKKDSINGISAEEILNNNPILNGQEIVLIYDDNENVTNIEVLKILKKVSGAQSDNVDEIMSSYFNFISNEPTPEENNVSLQERCYEAERENAELLLKLVEGGLM